MRWECIARHKGNRTISLRLREEYSKEWGTIKPDNRGKKPLVILGMGHKATSSISLVGIHYMYHLGEAIDISWRMLKEAKKYKKGWEKDAVYVALYSRSGKIAEAGPIHLLYPNPKEYPIFVSGKSWQGISVLKNINRLKWLISSTGRVKGHRSPLIDALELSRLIKGNKKRKYRISRRTLYELIDEMDLLEELESDVARAEIKRILKRHISISREARDKEKEIICDRLTDVLMYWHSERNLRNIVMLTKIADSLLGDIVLGDCYEES